MKSFLLVPVVILCGLSSLSSLADNERSLARIAREVGKSQGMVDFAEDIPAKLPKLEQPLMAEGFYPDVPLNKKNPLLLNLYAWAEALLKKEANEYGASVEGVEIFPVLGGSNPDYGTRTEMQVAKNLFYLVTHKKSEYYMDEELFTRYMRRVMAYANEYNRHNIVYSSKLNDFFAIGPAVYLMRMTREVYGDYLLPSQLKAMDDCMTKANDLWKKVYTDGKDKGNYPMGRYANRDIAVANILFNTGTYLKDEESLEIAKTLVHAQKDNLFPDGAIAYIGSQNDSPGYHMTDILFLTRYFVLTKDEVVQSILKKARLAPLLENEPEGCLSEFWTAPSWKQAWNYSTYDTCESVNYFNQCKWLRGSLDKRLAKSKIADPLEIPFYKAMSTKALPNNYTVVDRNLQGVRARYNDYSMAATLRETVPNEPGHRTLVGAMTKVEKNGQPEMEASLMLAQAQVFCPDASRKEVKRLGCITEGLKSDITFGRDYCAWGATHTLETNASSSKGVGVPFVGTQLYLSARDHLVGVISVRAKESQEAYYLAAMLRMGYGGFKKQGAPEVEKVSPKEYAYGQLCIRVLKTNFPEFEIKEAQVREGDNGAIASEFTFSVGKEEELKTFTKDEVYYLVYEIYPKSSKTKTSLQAFSCEEKLCLKMKAGRYSYSMIYKPEENKLLMKTDDKSKPWKNFEDLLNAASSSSR